MLLGQLSKAKDYDIIMLSGLTKAITIPKVSSCFDLVGLLEAL